MNAGGQERLDAAWREAAKITYRDYIIDYGNDGHPENDSVLPTEERQRQQAAITFIAQQTGIPEGFIHSQLLDAADAEGQARGFDTDPDYLAPPDWEDLATHWRERQTRIEAEPAETALGWRSGIEFFLDPACDELGNPILAEGQGNILRDGTFRGTGPVEELVGPAVPTDTSQQPDEPRVTATGPASEVSAQHAPRLLSAVRRASAMFFPSKHAPGTTPRLAASHPGGSGIGPSPHPEVAPGESPRSGRMR